MYYRSIKIILGFLLSFLLIIISPLLFSSIVNNFQANAMVEVVKLKDNLGNYHFPISSKSELAQKYFDQGMALTYGFNHAEAARFFDTGTKIDPNCVMCYWGLAYIQGPNINAPMGEEQVSPAWQAIQKAIAISDQGSPKEKAYITALAQRYSEKPSDDRSHLDLAYAQAMGKLVQDYPNDLDAATLYAEALMDTMPWDYWQSNGELKGDAKAIVQTLESVIKRNPQHPGANHLYIHVMEKERPLQAVKAADNLRDLIAGSGHLQHMPSHIYIRVGRYEDSVIANQKGIEADRQYLASAHPDSIYKFAYVPHNYHFLWFSALMTGQQKIATEAAEKTADVNQDLMRNPDFAGALQHFYVVPLYTDVRFGQWQKILGTPAPETDLKYPTGVWHYARGMAFANQGEQNKARKELAQLQNLMIDPELQELKIWGFNPTSSVLEIASEVLAGEIAKFDKDYTQAINHLRQATTLEDNLVYTEPPDWYSPTHNLLGKILLESDRLVEAEEAFREDLRIYPQNGWSLSGLAQSLKKQGKIAEANTVQQEYEEAWQYADFKL
jgi:tetratricopeptide (TPR) repeat protein